MSTLLIYAIKSAILLTLLLLPGILLLFREKMFRFNRATLLSIMVMSLVLPLCNISHLSMDDVPAVQTIEIGLLQAGFPVEVADYEIEAEQTRFPWFYVVSILYAIGVTVVLSIRMREIFSTERIMRLGSIWQKQEADGIRIFCHADNVAPFSWLRSIVIGERDYQDNGREVILHEKAHILHRHSLDILLLTFVEALQWWNPFVYLLGMYLRDVHEYQADDYVLSQGVSCHAYSELIIRKAVGASSYTFANSFNHSLTKKRITMMLNSNPSPWRRSRALYVIPVAALALSAFATPEFKNASDLIEETIQSQDKITESSANMQAEGEKNDSPAQFTGGQEAFGKWVSENMVYPPKAQEQGIQGQVAVQFTVEKDGSITEVEGIRSPDQLLTDEAVRLVKAMPKWIPAKNKGEIVRCVFVVTLDFRLC